MQTAHTLEVAPPAWMLPDRMGFPRWLRTTFKYATPPGGQSKGSRKGTGCGPKLFPQQRFIRDFLQSASPYRGVLLFHGLGSGKSLSALAATTVLAPDDVGPPTDGRMKRVVIMVPAFLHTNYVGEIKKFGAPRFHELGLWKRSTRSSSVAHPSSPTRRRVWLPGVGGTPYLQLTPAQRAQVSAQVNDDIGEKYQFIHYNGLTAARIAELCGGADNVFDDTVVVIDEAATFVQRVKNGGLVIRLYQRLLDAARCKIIMLSGTPLTNEPVELAYFVNLAHGYVHAIDFTLPSDASAARVKSLLDGNVRVESHSTASRVERGVVRRIATVLPYPEDFGRSPGLGRGMVTRLASGQQPLSVMQELRVALGAEKATAYRRLLLPLDAIVFNQTFLEEGEVGGVRGHDMQLRNGEVLMRRMMGTISVFDSDVTLMPTIRSTTLVRVELSNRQFDEYIIIRDDERRKERMARMFAAKGGNKGGEDRSGGGVYRTLSILVLLFVFPVDIKRPWPKDARAGLAPDACDSHDGFNQGGKVARVYEASRTAAMEQIRAATEPVTGESILSLSGSLSELSPKFAHLIRHLNAPDAVVGTAIVYSQFRSAEGITLLTMALDANGFEELRVARRQGVADDDESGAYGVVVPAFRPPHLAAARSRYIVYDNTDPAASDIALKIFRNDLDALPAHITRSLRGIQGSSRKGNLQGDIARLLLITQSGAEGISTKNVREVHVLEPFWHANRIQQVIGRAVRANSHAELPPDQRTVDVFVYISTFTATQRMDHTIARMDRGHTSDEHVFGVALRKLSLLKQFTKLMRRAAVDCSLHREKTGHCYSPGASSDETLAYDPMSLTL